MTIQDLQKELIEAAAAVARQCSQANLDRLTAVRIALTDAEAAQDAAFVKEAREPSAASIARAIEEIEYSARIARVALRQGNLPDVTYHMGTASRLARMVSRRDPKLSTIDL